MPPGPTGLHPYLDNLVRLSKVPVATIAEVRGRARGAGSEFILATDIRFAGSRKAGWALGVARHLQQLVEVLAKRRHLGLELVHAAAVAHVLGEVVEAVEPVEQRAGDEHQAERHEDHRPERDPVDVEDRPAEIDGCGVRVAENGRSDPQRESENERQGEKKTLPEMAHVGHPPKVTPLPGG